MSTLSNEADGAAAAAVMTPKAASIKEDAVMTPATGRASAASISKEDERRRKLQEWQESKASGKKAVAPERRAVPDRKAQFFERRERRLEEEKKKRMSRSGKENSGTPTTTATDPRSMVTPSAVASRLLSTPRPGQGPDAQGRLVGTTTPVSATRGPPPRVRQAATTPSAARGASSHADTASTSTIASAGAPGTGGAETAGTPSRSSALLRPKASPYKDKSLQSASKTAAFGIDQPPVRSSTTPGDRLSGQLARLGAAGAGSRREGRVGGGGGGRGVAVGAAARRETFQGSRAFSTTDSGAAGVIRARPILRRVSSAMLASEVVVSSGEADKRRLASSAAAQRKDQHQVPSTPTARAAPAMPRSTSDISAVQPLRVSARSPNTSSTTRLQLHPTTATPKENAVLSSSSTTAAPVSAPIPVAVPKTAMTTPTVIQQIATVPAEETNATSVAEVDRPPLRVAFGEGVESRAAKAVLVPDILQEPVSVKAGVPGGMSEKVTAVSQRAEESRRAESIATLRDDATRTVTAALTVTAVDEKVVREVRRWQAPWPSPRPSSDEKPVSYEGAEEGVGHGAGLIARERKPDAKITEERHKLSVCGGIAKGAAAMPKEAVPVPVKPEQTRGASLPAAPAPTATAETPPVGTVMEVAAAKDGEESAAEDNSAPAVIPSSAEVAAVMDEGGSMEQKLSLFSRFSSVFSRRQQPAATSTTMDGTGTSGEGSASIIAAEVKGIPDDGSPSALDLDNTGEKSPVAPTGGAEPTREVVDHSAASSPAAETKLSEECPARESPDETQRLFAQASKEEHEEAAATIPAAARSAGSTVPGNHSKLSSPPAGRTHSPLEEGRIGLASATQAAEQVAAGPCRPRPALTPPGYRSRPSPPPADRTDARREEGPVEPTSRSPKEVTTPSPPGPRPTGLTPPGYLSRLSPPSAGKLVSPRGHVGKENEAKSSARAPSSGLTPPGYRSRLSPVSAGGMESPSREKHVVDPASSLSSVGGSGLEKLTPDRRDVGAPACVRPAGDLGDTPTPPRSAGSSSQEFSSPAREEPKQGRSQGDVPAAEDEHEKAEAREKGVGCSPIGPDGGAGVDRPKDGDGRQYFSPGIVNGRASTQPLLAGVVTSPGTSSPAQQQPQKQQQRRQHAVRQNGSEEVQTKDTACSPMTRSGSRKDAAGGSLEALNPTEQQQRSPESGSADADAIKAEEKEQPAQTKQRAACLPIARGGGSRKDGVAPECSTPRFGTARIVSTPPTARSSVEGSGVGVSGPDAAYTPTLLPGGRAAARASPSPPPQPTDERHKRQEDGSPTEFHCKPNFADGFVAGRRKRRALSDVPVVTAAAAQAESVAESLVGGDGDGGRRVSSRPGRAKQSQEERKGGGRAEGDEESSSGESGSSWETCSSSEEEEGEEERGEGEWEGLSYLDAINEHPYTGGVVIDPDLVRSSSSSTGGGSTRSSLPRSSFGEARSGGRRSWGLKPPSVVTVVTAEMGTQTGDGEGVKHALVQAGDGKLLSKAELQDECEKKELRERLEMMNHDRLAEVFHREILKQEEAQARKKLSEQHDAERLELRKEVAALKLAHNNEKIRIRWEHADELARVEAEAGNGAGLMEELQEERRLREQDEEHHVAAQQKERQQRREWEARCDDLVRDKREQAKRHSEEIRNQATAEKKKLEALKKKLKKMEELMEKQLHAVKVIDQENDVLREENARLREKLGMEVEEDGEEELG